MNVFKDKKTFIEHFKDEIESIYAIQFERSNSYQQYVALGSLLKQYVSKDWIETKAKEHKMRQVYYFSMEFLMGRMITNNLMSAGVYDLVEEAFKDLGLDINEIEHQESDAGLGNGGLGRLAACFMDSSASLGLPVHGNCLRYRYGFFKQSIENGYQVEYPDNWLKDIHVWEIRRAEEAVEIPFYGYIDITMENGKLKVLHRDAEYVKAVPYDVPIIGYKNQIVNTLRLWNTEASDIYYNKGGTFEYHKKLRQISEMLYPNDDTDEGKVLRLKQQYLFSAAGVNSIVRRHKNIYGTLANLHDYVIFHINDTHPTLIIPELMRILVDEENMEWEDAWFITKNSVAFTNHTILSEALEKWPIRLFQPLLPRIYTITEEINRRFLLETEAKFGKNAREIYNTAIIKDGVIHMANLAVATSFSVNGVAKLHTSILKSITFNDFDRLYPKKINAKTNGITHRRWLLQSNNDLVKLIKASIGDDFINNPSSLEKLLAFKDNEDFKKKFRDVKHANKVKLADIIFKQIDVKLDPNSIFDIQVKRLHEYKRQLLNALHIIYLYYELKENEEFRNNFYPQSFIFGAKSAPTYHFAKKVIKLINTIALKVNNDELVSKYLKVAFVEDYNVTYAEVIMPAADISEQISTASKEASGTGNMKFMMNGALTLGTLDGANVEINELVTDENMILFGLKAEEVTELERLRTYNPLDIYRTDFKIKRVVDSLTNGFFNNVNKDEFKEISDSLLKQDRYFVLKDFNSYKDAQAFANNLYKNQDLWTEKAIINTAKSGFFSTDRTIADYNQEIWKLNKVK